MMKFEVKKSRMAPVYDPEAIRREIAQHYVNAETLRQRAEFEVARAKEMEQVLAGLDQKASEAGEVTEIVDG